MQKFLHISLQYAALIMVASLLLSAVDWYRAGTLPPATIHSARTFALVLAIAFGGGLLSGGIAWLAEVWNWPKDSN